MASAPRLRLLQRIKEAARLIVTAVTWAQIAERMGYKNGESARVTIQGKHPELWHEAYEEAYAAHIATLVADAELTQRQLLKSDDERIRQSAAHSLMAHADKLRAQHIQISGGLSYEITGRDGRPIEVVLDFRNYGNDLNGNGDAGEGENEDSGKP